VIETIIKADGRMEPFDAGKLNRWGQYAAKTGGDWSTVVMKTVKRLPKVASSDDVHQTMIDVCVELESLEYSKLAARLQFATLRKNLGRLGVSDSGSFEDIYETLCGHGVWDKESLPEYNPVWELWYKDLYQLRMDYWQVKQFDDKYGLKYKGKVVETPHIAALGLALSHHGTTELAYKTAKAILSGKLNLPTPALNGGRNGDFDSVSCCVITGGDTVDSIGVAEHIAYKMTAKKAGIGIEFNTRSKGSPVKGGRVAHLGKHGIYSTVDKAVKMFSQITRGGSATVTYAAIDPQIMEMLLWKTQKIDIEQRIDKLDYSLAYNDSFVNAVISNDDWYLFDYASAPEVHEAFYTEDSDGYNLVVEQNKHKAVSTIKAQELLKRFLTSRQETGRIYCLNVTRANTHTPFIDKITLSNLCVAPETKILTRDGYREIWGLEGRTIDIWNGEEWSSVDVVKTGVDQEMISVSVHSYVDGKFEGTNTLRCTPYHKWYNLDGKGLRTFQLQVGGSLLPWHSPDGRLHYSIVENLEVSSRSDTFCFKELKRGMGVFNGILTGQCQEIMLPTKAYEGMYDLYQQGENPVSVGETAFCSLAAINVGKLNTDLSEYEELADIALRTVDSMISKTSAMTQTMFESMQRRRSVGIGITGLAQYLYNCGSDYTGDTDSLLLVSKLAEKHYHSLLVASQGMVTDGSCKPVSGINLNWLPVDTAYNKYEPHLDWESLRGKDRGHSVLVAHMPTESSAVFSGATNGLYPPRNKIIYKQSRKGAIQFILDKDNFIPFWDVDNIVMSKYYSRVQDFTDQGISADYVVVPEKHPNGKVPLSHLMKEWVAQARLGNKTMYYVNTKPNKSVSVKDLVASKEVEVEACEGGCKI
jgi:ribonucleotide reductase alpha subunit